MLTCQNKEQLPAVPDACPVCDVLLRSLDRRAFEYSGACADCTMVFVGMNKDAWDAGWRPDQDEIDARLQKRTEEPFFYVSDGYI